MPLFLAQTWHGDHMDGGWWWVMGIGWLLFLLVLAGLGYVMVRHLTRDPRSPNRASADDILAERFARGEIDEDDYRRRREALRQSH